MMLEELPVWMLKPRICLAPDISLNKRKNIEVTRGKSMLLLRHHIVLFVILSKITRNVIMLRNFKFALICSNHRFGC